MSIFTGCGAKKSSIQISREYILLAVSNNGGSICQSLRYGVDKDKMSKISSSLKEELDFRKSLLSQIETLRNEMLMSFAISYLQNPIKEFRINSGVILTNVAFDDKNSCAGFDIIFTSNEAWKYYHNIEEKTSEKKGFFIDRQVSRGIYPFSVKMKEDGKLLGERYKEIFFNAISGYSFEDKLKKEYSPQFIYLYSTPYQKINSDATFSYRSDKLYHHLWVKEKLSENDEITLSVNTIYYGWWILLVLVISLTGMAGGIIIVKICEKKKR